MILAFSACSQKQPTEEKANVIDTIPVMVMQSSLHSRSACSQNHHP